MQLTITISGWVCVERIREEDHISGPIDLSGDAEDRKEKRGTGSWTWAINKYIDRMHPNAAAEEEEEDEEGGLKSSCSLVLPGPTHLFRPPVNWMHIYTSCILSDLLLVLMMVMNNLSPTPPLGLANQPTDICMKSRNVVEMCCGSVVNQNMLYIVWVEGEREIGGKIQTLSLLPCIGWPLPKGYSHTH